MSLYQLVYGKSCHLSIELEHKAMWAMNKLNLDWGDASTQRVNDLYLLNEFRLEAYERATLCIDKMNKYHDKQIKKQDFVVGNIVFLFNSRLHLFP